MTTKSYLKDKGLNVSSTSIHKKIKRTFDKTLFQLKTKGVRNLLPKLIRRGRSFLFERKILVFLETSPEELSIENLPKIQTVRRLGTIEDVEKLAATRGSDDGQIDWWRYEFKKRFEQGKLCFIAFQGDEVAFNIWGSSDDIYDPDIKKKVKLSKDEVYLFDAWWSYRYRSKTVAYTLFEFIINYFREKKIQRVMGYTTKDNIAPLRIWKNMGFKDTGRIRFSRFVGFWRYSFDEKTKERFI